MPWGSCPAPCPCRKCAKLPEPNVIAASNRGKHKKLYGVEGPSAPEEVKEEARAPSPSTESDPENRLHVVNVEAFARDVVLLTVNEAITWKSVEDLIKLFNHHTLGAHITTPLPATCYRLKRESGCMEEASAAKLFDVCHTCDFVFDAGQEVCVPCNLPPRRRVKRQLFVNDIAARIKAMFANPFLAEALGYAATRKTGDGDVWDGEMMRNIPPGTFCSVLV